MPWRRINCLMKHCAMETYWRSGGIPPRTNLGIRWRWVVSFTLQPIYSRYPLDMRLCRSEWGGEEKKIPSPCREWNPGLLARRLASILTELPRLLNATYTRILHTLNNVQNNRVVLHYSPSGISREDLTMMFCDILWNNVFCTLLQLMCLHK